MSTSKTTKSDLHSEILRAIAREELQPLGLFQKGRSRSWLDDHGWWVAIVEFQPSGFAKGSYLNVGVCWLWHEKDYFSFDVGGRVQEFAKFINEDQFKAEARKMTLAARQEVIRFRNLFPTVKGAAAYLKRNGLPKNTWHMFDAGIAAGCIGDKSHSLLSFNRVLDTDAKAEFEIHRRDTVQKLIKLLPETEAFRAQIEASIQNARSLLKLQEKPGPLLN